MRPGLMDDFVGEANGPGDSVVGAALVLAQVAYPRLEPERWIAALDELGTTARRHLEVGVGGHPPRRTRLRVISEFFFGQLGFTGNREHYDDPRNSFLNDVIARRTGIPISLAVVFIEVARRAGLVVEGVNFPGHFLMRCPVDPHESDDREALIVDPFHGGAVLNDDDCLRLLRTHAGAETLLEPGMLAGAGKRAILLRMLLNLKRSFVRLRSFQHAREIAELLVAMDPSALTELRDRGLLASHLRDYASALRDLESWLQRTDAQDDAARAEVKEVWEHVKALRRRLASLN
jgi:regulator of sirC expression with transglutaminase-like and TPR domain